MNASVENESNKGRNGKVGTELIVKVVGVFLLIVGCMALSVYSMNADFLLGEVKPEPSLLTFEKRLDEIANYKKKSIVTVYQGTLFLTISNDAKLSEPLLFVEENSERIFNKDDLISYASLELPSTKETLPTSVRKVSFHKVTTDARAFVYERARIISNLIGNDLTTFLVNHTMRYDMPGLTSNTTGSQKKKVRSCVERLSKWNLYIDQLQLYEDLSVDTEFSMLRSLAQKLSCSKENLEGFTKRLDNLIGRIRALSYDGELSEELTLRNDILCTCECKKLLDSLDKLKKKYGEAVEELNKLKVFDEVATEKS